jgi:hypothetical protein
MDVMICKVYIDVKEAKTQGFVTLKYGKEETVRDVMIKIVTDKLNMNIDPEELVSKYALVLQGIPGTRYFPLDFPFFGLLPGELLKVHRNHFLLTQISSMLQQANQHSYELFFHSWINHNRMKKCD